jgi:hypothetical protein
MSRAVKIRQRLASAPTAFRAAPTKSGAGLRVERKGGRYGAGLIRDVSVITRGEALDHDAWCDSVMLAQVADAINATDQGVKTRFTHPSMSGDGLGRYTGRMANARVVGDQVLAEQHFAKSAHKTPDGDLAAYLMNLASEDPQAYGMSIAFRRDLEAEQEFTAEHGDREFVSPDPKNTNHYEHVRVAELTAVDAVDTPAANPDGLFHQMGAGSLNVALEADSVAAYALGLSDDKPAAPVLGVDPERMRGFCTRFLATRGLTLQPKGDAMSAATIEAPADDTVQTADTVVETADVAETEATEPVAAEKNTEAVTETTTETATETQPAELSSRATEGKRFLEAFGDRGAVWFAEGKTFDEARDAYTAHLLSENQSLRDRLAKFAAAETSPVDFQSETRPGDKQRGGLEARIRVVGSAR